MTTTPAKKLLGFSDLQAYQACPRAFAWKQEGWRNPIPSKALLRGLLFHDIVSKYLYPPFEWHIDQHVHPDMQLKAKDVIAESLFEAKKMAKAYLSSVDDFSLILPPDAQLVYKDTLGDERIGGHADLIVWHNGKRVLVEMKTGRSPAPDILDMSGQSDFYALLYEAQYRVPIDYIYLDCISEGGVLTRHQRPPNLNAGQYILQELLELDSLTYSKVYELGKPIEAMTVIDSTSKLLAKPHYSWRCEHCDFLRASKAYDKGTDYELLLDTLMIKQEDRRLAI